MQMVNTAEEPEKGRRLPGVRERGGWANGGSWWPFSVSGDRRWFFCGCSSSLGVETQRSCWRSRRWLRWWRRWSPFLYAFLPLCFCSLSCSFSFSVLFRFLLCCCWWQLLLAALLVTRQNDDGAASNSGGRETRERDELLFFSFVLLFFCSFLLFSCQLKSSPLCLCLPCFQNNLCSSLKQSPASFSLFGSFLQVRFPKVLPPLVSFFFLFLPRFRSLLPSFLQKIYPPLPPYFVFFSFLLFSFLFSSPFSLENPLFRSSFLFCIRAVFIGAGGAGSTLPRPIIYMGCEAAAPPCHGTGWDVQWGRRLQDTAPLFSHHEEVQVASGFGFNRARGRGMRGREKQGKKTKTSLPLLHVQGKKKEK